MAEFDNTAQKMTVISTQYIGVKKFTIQKRVSHKTYASHILSIDIE